MKSSVNIEFCAIFLGSTDVLKESLARISDVEGTTKENRKERYEKKVEKSREQRERISERRATKVWNRAR